MEDLEFKTILGYIMRLCLPKQTKSHIKEHRQIEELEFRVFLYILLSEGFNFVHRVPESYDTISNGGGRAGFSPCS